MTCVLNHSLISIIQNSLQENVDSCDSQMMTPAAVQLEGQSTGAIKMSVYAGYFKSMGSVPVIVAALCMLAFEQFVVGALDYYVSYWYVSVSVIMTLSLDSTEY